MAEKTKRISIKWKIFSYLLGFCALLLLILWLFQTVLLDSFYRGIKVMEIKGSTNEIAKYLDNSSMLSAVLSYISQSSECYIEIIAPSGTVSASAGNMKNNIPVSEKADLLSNLKGGGEYIEYISNDFRNGFGAQLSNPRKSLQSIVYLKKFDNNYIILINSVISPVDATINTLRYQLYFITCIMILLSVILAVIISKKVSKPIEKLNVNAKVLAKGDYNVTFHENGYKEIGELSDTLNVAATELNKVEMLRRELMANISHDLRTPLSLIYGYAEVMHDFPDEVTEDKTQIIMDETQRLSSLVNDIFDISKLESGIENLNLASFNLTRSIKITTERIAELLKKEGYTITFESDKEITLKADEVKITQAFYNLLINAVNYSGTDKMVRVKQTTSSENVKIEISDTGEGITKDALPYIWDRYYKADKTHKRAVTGTGLGLSIVKKIIDLHGGKYGVESQKGEGSTFWFSLKII